MNQPSPRELELTGDLLEFAKATALKETRKRCPKHISYKDIAQEVLLQLLFKPPKFDPTKGASEKTLLHTAIYRLVLKRVGGERRRSDRFQQASEDPADHRRKSTAGVTIDDILRFIDCEESRTLCRCFVECDGNRTQVAKQLGITEGTVRYRIKLLAPKMLAAGFDPDQYGEFYDNRPR